MQRSIIRDFSQTVMAADCMGTAAAYPHSDRLAYDNNGREERAYGNEGFNLDPPRLTNASDKCSSHRSAVDPRHIRMVNAVYLDSHASTISPTDLGYATRGDGTALEQAEGDLVPNNRLFSGQVLDRDPPDLPGS